MSPRLVFIVVVGAYLVSSCASGGSVGANSECVNSNCLVNASSSLASLLVGTALALFVVKYQQRPGAIDNAKVVGFWRRIGAFVTDCAVVLLVLAPVAALPLLVVEGHYTGTFHWAFERRFSRSTDMVILLPGIAASFAGLFLYFYVHARFGRPTVGQYVLGFRVTASGEPGAAPNWGARVVYSFMGLCMWPVSVLLAWRTPQKICWWDSRTYTRVIRVQVLEAEVRAGGA